MKKVISPAARRKDSTLGPRTHPRQSRFAQLPGRALQKVYHVILETRQWIAMIESREVCAQRRVLGNVEKLSREGGARGRCQFNVCWYDADSPR